jgi:transcriptional regulator with XRE-family HTH domain
MSEFEKIGSRLQSIRKGLSSLSQRDWAEKNGFNATQYNNWEKGSRRIPLDAAERLCDRYGLTLDSIYRGRLDGVSQEIRNIF